MKKKTILFCILTLMTVLFLLPVHAMEPVKNGITIKNQGKEDIVVDVFGQGELRQVEIKKESSAYVEFTFTEPDTYKYQITKENPTAEDLAYIARFYVETLEDGTLQSYAVVQIDGQKVKPAEITYGTPPEEEKKSADVPVSKPKTGDTSNVGMYAVIAISSLAVVLLVVIIILLTRRKKEQEG